MHGPNGLSGILDLHKDVKRMEKEAKEMGAKLTVKEIPCFPLAAVLDQYGFTHIDLLSLDVEGAELVVLETIDFQRVHFSVLLIEAAETKEANQGVDDYLQQHGFRKLAGLAVQQDFVYVNDKLLVAGDSVADVSAQVHKRHAQWLYDSNNCPCAALRERCSKLEQQLDVVRDFNAEQF